MRRPLIALRSVAKLTASLFGCVLAQTAFSQAPLNVCAYPQYTGGGAVQSTPSAGQTTIGNYEVWAVAPGASPTRFTLAGHSWDIFEHVTTQPLSTDPGPGNRTNLGGTWYTFEKASDYTTSNHDTYPTWYVIQPNAPGSLMSGITWTTPLIKVTYGGKFNDEYTPSGPNQVNAATQAGTVSFAVVPNPATQLYDGTYLAMEVDYGYPTVSKTVNYCLSLFDSASMGSPSPGAPFEGTWGASSAGSISATYQSNGYALGLLFYDERLSGGSWSGQPVWATAFLPANASGASALTPSASNVAMTFQTQGAPWDCTSATACGSLNPTMPTGASSAIVPTVSFGAGASLNAASIQPALSYTSTQPYHDSTAVEWNSTSAVSMHQEYCSALMDATPAGSSPTDTLLGCPDVDTSAFPSFSTCATPNGSTTCPVSLRWRIVDGYPNATMFAIDTSSGTSTAVSANGTLASTGTTYNMPAGKSYRFEVHTGAAATSPVIARSQVITASGSTAVQPTCTSEAPATSSTPPGATTQRIYAYGVQNATNVLFPTWWIPGAQNYIEWVQGYQDINNPSTWYADVQLSHFDPSAQRYGSFETDVYMFNSGYTNVFCGGGNWTRQPPSTGGLPPLEAEVSDAVPVHDATVGSAPGSAGTSGGAATYTIPIVAPPGRAGMQPSIALSYNSRAGNGPLGVGWSISGLSSIHRCPQTPEQDGQTLGVSYTLNDRLCLDGQRLVPVSGNNADYGKAGTEYRTEVDSYARIFQTGGNLDQGASAVCFRVEQRDGRILHYGGVVDLANTPSSCSTAAGANSQVKPTGAVDGSGRSVALSWLVEKIEDRVGNNQLYYYTDNGSGEVLPKQIAYTGSGSTAGTRSVNFVYTNRASVAAGCGTDATKCATDRTTSYLAGGYTMQTRALQCVTTGVGAVSNTCNSANVVRTYTPAYFASAYSGRLMMTDLTECATANGSTACHPATHFDINDDAPSTAGNFALKSLQGLQFSPDPSSDQPYKINIPGDLDGDGTRDAFVTVAQTDAIHTYLAQMTADRVLHNPVDVSSYFSCILPECFGDIDGSGRSSEIMFNLNGTSGSVSFGVWALGRGAVATGNPLTTISSNLTYTTSTVSYNQPKTFFMSDFDGDGKTDVVLVLPNDTDCLSTALGANSGVYFYKNLSSGLLSSTNPGNFAPKQLLFCLKVTNLTTSSGQPVYDLPTIDHVSDFNGDGLPDFFLVNGGTSAGTAGAFGGVYLTKRSGTTLIASTLLAPSSVLQCSSTSTADECNWAYNKFSTRWMDVNGDGLEDFVFARPVEASGPPSWHIRLNQGNGALAPSASVAAPAAGNGYVGLDKSSQGAFRYASSMAPMDVDSDGKPDILIPRASTGAAGDYSSFALKVCTASIITVSNVNGCPYAGVGSLASKPPQTDSTTIQCVEWSCPENPGTNTLVLPANTGPSTDGNSKYEWGTLSAWGIYAGGPPGIGGPDKSVYYMSMLKFVQTGPQAFSAVVVDTPMVSRLGDGRAEDLFGDGLTDLTTTVGCSSKQVSVPTPPGNGSYPNCSVVGTYSDGVTYGPTTFPDGTPSSNFVGNWSLYANINQGVIAAGGSPAAGAVGTPPAYTITASANPITLNLSPPILPGLLAQAKNGLGDTAQWGYAPLSTPASQDGMSLYSTWNSTFVDDRHFFIDSSMPVVYGMTQSTGTGGMLGARSSIYGYFRGLYNHFGRGFQGFASIATETSVRTQDQARRTRITTNYNQKFPLTGQIIGQSTWSPATGYGFTATQLSKKYQCMTRTGGVVTAIALCAQGAQLAPLPTGTTVFQPLLVEQDEYSYDPKTGGQLGHTVTTNTWDTLGYGALESQTVTQYDDGSADSFVFVTQHQTTTSNTYSFDASSTGCADATSSWWINELCKSVVTASVTYNNSGRALPSGATAPIPETLTTLYTWNTDRTPATKTVQATNAATDLSTAYQYPSPSYGLPSQVQTCLGDYVGGTCSTSVDPLLSPVRTTSYGYTSDNYFVYQTKTSIASPSTACSATQSSSSCYVKTETHQNSDGQLTSGTAINGATTSTSYDPFGRVTRIDYTGSDGTAFMSSVQMAYTKCSAGACPASGANYGEDAYEAQAAYKVTAVQQGYPTKVKWYDLLGREVKTAERGYLTADPFVETLTLYDALGNVSEKFSPFYQSSSPSYFTSWAYDPFHRPVTKQESRNDTAASHADFVTRYRYSGRTTWISAYAANMGTYSISTDDVTCNSGAGNLCMKMSRVQNSLGQYMHTTDAAGGATDYWTDPLGHIAIMTDPKTNAMVATYNGLGQRTQSKDPDQGTWTFTYDAFGELLSQTDARSITTSVKKIDGAGHVMKRQEVPLYASTTGSSNESVLDEWSYDAGGNCAATHCIGQVVSASRWRAAGTSVPLDTTTAKWSETYNYDAAGRQIAITTNVNEVAAISFNSSMTFDSYGRPSTHTYPSNFVEQNYYAAYGHLGGIGAPGAIWWKATAHDPWGKVSGEAYLDGTTGAFTYAQDTGVEKTATWGIGTTKLDALTYTYDSFQNLIAQQRTAEGPVNAESYGYDVLQRLTSDGRPTSTTSYGYTPDGNIDYKTDYSLNSAGAYLYAFANTRDASSNCGPHTPYQVNLTPSGARAYSCDANGNVYSASGGSTTMSVTYDAENHPRTVSNGGSITWAYDSNGNRDFESSSSGTRYFVAGGFEQSGFKMIHELGPIILTRNGSTDSITTALIDRLGSTIDTVDNGTGASTNTRSYDPFGKVRNGDLTDRTNGTLNLNDTIHGFTKHEHADTVQLIHMGGRLYDYNLGRFLSVDPIIGNALSSQASNPYSYVLNNPLSSIDPTGYACSAMTGTHICGVDTGAIGGVTTYSGHLTSTDAKTGSTTSTPVNIDVDGHGRIVNIQRSGADIITARGAQSTPTDGQASSVGGQNQNLGQAPAASPLAGPPASFTDNLGQRFSNLAHFGKFNTDEQQNNYIAMLATIDFQQGHDALQGFMQKDSPVSGTKAAVTMVAGGLPGTMTELGTVSVTATAQDIIAANAQRIANGGYAAWKGYLSAAEQATYAANPGMRQMLAGQAVHRGTAETLEMQFPKRFEYRTKGPDFLDKSTGELIELTTPGQVGAHMARPGYGEMTYSTYKLPEWLPHP